MGPVIALYRSRNRFGIASGRTLTLTALDAADVLLTLNAHASQSGDLFLVQASNGDDKWRMHSGFTLMPIVNTGGAPTVTSPAGMLDGRGHAADHTSVAFNLRNYNTGNASARINIAGDACSGYLGAACTGSTSPSGAAADHVVLVANSDAAGIQLWANGASQTIQFRAGSTTEVMRLAGDSVRIGASFASALAKLHVVGASDQLQFLVKGNSTQTANLQEWQNSAGTVQALMTGAGALAVGTTTSAGRLRVATGAAGTRGIVVDAAASQTANLIECNDSGAAILTKIGPDGRVYIKSPNSAPTDADLVNNSLTWYLNEATPAVLARIRKSDGTYLLLTITNGASPTLA